MLVELKTNTRLISNIKNRMLLTLVSPVWDIQLGQNIYVNKCRLINFELFVNKVKEGRKASHNNFSSEPHSPLFLVRTTSKSSSFDYYVLKSFYRLRIKLFLANLAALGHKNG